MDRRQGTILWQLDLESPVIATYTVTQDGLLTLPFTSVAEGTLDNLLGHFVTKPTDIQLLWVILFKIFYIKYLLLFYRICFMFFSPTLYIGQHRYGLYALPSLIDSTTATISSKSEYLLLEGPLTIAQIHKNDNRVPLPGDHVVIGNIHTAHDGYQSVTREKSIITLGNMHNYNREVNILII